MINKWLPGMSAIVAASMLTGCGGGDEKKAEQAAVKSDSQISITASGSSFVYPVMTRWAQQYNEQHAVKVNYQATGSGAGIRQMMDRLVDFAATDQPLTQEQLNTQKLQQFPLVLGGIVVVVNLPGVKNGELTLDGSTLSNIFSGKITNWHDPAIQALNANVTLPEQAITVVHRADGSGTTYNFTDYLAKVDAQWSKNVGVDSSVKWPVGVGAKGNAGVATYVQRMNGAIGYVEYAYALQNGLAWTKMTNHDGKVVEPTALSFQSAVASVDWTAHSDFNVSLTNQAGENTWPLTATVFILMPLEPQDKAKQQAIFKFFDWVYSEGESFATELDYVPLPKDVITKVQTSWNNK